MNDENRPQQVPANADGNLRETHDDESALHSDWGSDESIHESLGDGVDHPSLPLDERPRVRVFPLQHLPRLAIAREVRVRGGGPQQKLHDVATQKVNHLELIHRGDEIAARAPCTHASFLYVVQACVRREWLRAGPRRSDQDRN